MSEPTSGSDRHHANNGAQHAQSRVGDAKVRRGIGVGLIAIIVVGLIALAGVIAVIVVMVRRPVTVPMVVMMDQSQASAALSGAHLRVGAVSHLATASVGAGFVVAQMPHADTKSVVGSTVDLTLAEQPQPAPAPDVVGMTQSDAIAKLTSAQFVPVQYEQYSATVTAGQVVGQLPAAQTPYVTGRRVVFSVSLGSPTAASVTVPSLAGIDDLAAHEALQSAGLVGLWLYNTVSTEPQGHVLDQLPRAGVRVPVGARVAVWVAGQTP